MFHASRPPLRSGSLTQALVIAEGASVKFRVRVLLVAVFGTLCASCASSPCREPVSPSPFKTSEPVQVVASVDQFRYRAAWIDFERDFIAYDSIVLTVSKPDRHALTRLFIQYQGAPIVNGRRIELGDTLQFTVPASASSGCCEPYLNDINDIQFVDRDRPER